MQRTRRNFLLGTAALGGSAVIASSALLRRAAAVTTSKSQIRGVSLAHLHRNNFGYGSDECRKQLEVLSTIGANWIALNDFAYMREVDKPEVRFGRDRTLSEDNVKRTVADAHSRGIKVLIKPHIWSGQFASMKKWHGDIKMTSEADWDTWFGQYGEFALHHAKLAQDAGADGFCVGCEYEGTTGSQEKRWRDLVAKTRAIFTGPICYSSAMGEWPKMNWWDAVDCIGINAYFPLVGSERASEREVRAGWAKVWKLLRPFSQKWKLPICFTELGYSASPRAAIEPWSYDVPSTDFDFQARLYRVALEEVATQDYMHGVFLWKWFTSDRFKDMEGDEPFAIQDRTQVVDAIKSVWRGS